MLLDYKAVGEALSVSPRTVRKMVADGELEAIRVRGSVRFEPAAIARYVDEHRMETRMASGDVTSSLVGSNDYMKGGTRETTLSTAFPGNGTATESGPAGGGAAWQSWQSGDDLVGDEPVTGVVGSGRVSGGIIATEPDAYPGFRPAGFGVGYGPDVPAWAQDSPSDGVDYDTPPNADLSSPSRPWSSGPRPSDVGTTAAFFDSTGQIPQGVPDSTGTTGPRRLRRDNSAQGTLP
jgi:excisionase family DNA binding protein